MLNQENLPKVLGQYKFNSKIANWFDLKGTAEVLYKPLDLEDLQNFLQKIDKKIAVQIIGAGSNVIISDNGVSGVLIKLPAKFAEISHNHETIKIGAGALCQTVASYCKIHGIAGLEFLSGIPGSIGGAIAMNAGCYGSDIANTLISSQALDFAGNIHNLSNQDFGFYYRGSQIAKKYLFIEGTFKYQPSTPQIVADKIAELMSLREQSQPIRAKTGGSTFKNPANHKAWQLIDAVGFRGKRVGDCEFSNKHCNFLINVGSATSHDLLTLGNQAKQAVKEKFQIDLEWEIKELK